MSSQEGRQKTRVRTTRSANRRGSADVSSKSNWCHDNSDPIGLLLPDHRMQNTSADTCNAVLLARPNQSTVIAKEEEKRKSMLLDLASAASVCHEQAGEKIHAHHRSPCKYINHAQLGDTPLMQTMEAQ